MKKKVIILLVLLGCFIVTTILESCQSNDVDTARSTTSLTNVIPDKIDFNFHVKPILSDRCFTCHGPDQNTMEADLSFHQKDLAFAALGENKDRYAIVPHHPDSSTLIHRIFTENTDDVMPPPESNLRLEEHEKEILKKWISQGAEWKEHWAFTPPSKSEYSKLVSQSNGQNIIDFLVNQKLKSYSLTPSPRAIKEKLIRRVYFDLTGLPPRPDEILLFTKDESPNALENIIDKLLKSDAYAERMTMDWLDLARYADTNGYQDDFERFNWPWRDWVIHAFKKNMPYDKFVTVQLAGDLLENPSFENLVATGFNRNHKITNEGGVIPEEYRVEYVSDRTNTFATAFLGMTMECAKCHDHKYDPLSQKNYFELFSFFNNVPEEGFVANGTKPEPTITLTEKEIQEKLSFIETLGEMKELTYMVMKEMDEPRQAYILNRGAYDRPTTPVFPNTPEGILPFEGFEKNRKGLSDWLFDENNPLTARVAVNKLWQQFFGKGIVATPYDFGNQGALPTHPELLDFLAIKFREDDWDIQKMIKYIMLSETYQQSSKVSPQLLEIDPENNLLARAPRLRLQAEMIRDHALRISELLVNKVGGPSVKPYQPAGLWSETTGGGGGSTAKYVEDEEDGLYRRSLYTFWKRTVPPPSMMTFDAASRDQCTVKRQNTSTPLQALVMLNDPQIVEASRMLAYRSVDDIDDGLDERIEYMFQLATSRIPNKDEVKALKDFYYEEEERFLNDTDSAEKYLKVGNFQMEEIIEPHRLAALSAVGSAIMNLDESITRG